MIPDPKPPATEPEVGVIHVFDTVFEERTACALDEENNLVWTGNPTLGTNGQPAPKEDTK